MVFVKAYCTTRSTGFQSSAVSAKRPRRAADSGRVNRARGAQPGHTVLLLLSPALLLSCFTHPSAVVAQESVPAVVAIEHGRLAVTFRDNGQSPQVLSGVDSLFHQFDAPHFDAFDPDARGASAGLNFEHIISGHRNPNNKFTPRSGRYALKRLAKENSVALTRAASDSPWNVASSFDYTVAAPHYVDFEFRCTPQDARLFGEHGYAIFFFANYMNDVDDVALHFRGKDASDAPEKWIAADAPPGHPDYRGGGNYRAVEAGALPYDDEVQFRLNTWSYEWPRISQPFYYGRAGNGMTLILMFDRLHTSTDEIRFSLYKFKLPKHPRPAWDFQYVVRRLRAGAEYGFRGRLVWKKFVSAEDCWEEYSSWAATLR